MFKAKCTPMMFACIGWLIKQTGYRLISPWKILIVLFAKRYPGSSYLVPYREPAVDGTMRDGNPETSLVIASRISSKKYLIRAFSRLNSCRTLLWHLVAREERALMLNALPGFINRITQVERKDKRWIIFFP